MGSALSHEFSGPVAGLADCAGERYRRTVRGGHLYRLDGQHPAGHRIGSNGVLFAGIMDFDYSDPIVPPLVAANAKYNGWRVALYIASIMFVSIVPTSLILDGAFTLLEIVPEGARQIAELTQFKIDYTFWMNVVSVAVVGGHIYLWRQHWRMQEDSGGHEHDHSKNGLSVKRLVVYLFIAVLVGFAITGGTALR